MTAVDVPAVQVGAAPGTAVLALAARQIRRGALMVVAVAAGMSALVAATYRSTVGDDLTASSLAALATNPAIRTLFGQPAALDDPGGFTVWRTGTVVAVLIGVWALLTATRVTRGAEQAGQWDLLLAGRLPLGDVVARHLAILVAAVTLVGAAVTAALVATGTGVVGALLHGGVVMAGGVFFAGLGMLAAQVFPTRSAASGAAMAVLGAGLLMRMVGDGVDALSWLRWASPFGLAELVQPYGANRWPPLLVLSLAAVAVVILAPAVARHRDLRGGLLAPESGRPPRRYLLGSVSAFAIRRLARPLVGWSAGIGAYFLLIGSISVSMTDFLADNPRFAELAAQAGFAGLGTARGYVAALFALLAIPVGGFTAVRVAAFAADEAARRLTLLFAGPVTRRTMIGAELLAAASGVLVLAVVAGCATWIGTSLAGADLSLPNALAGTLNVLPVALLCLGASVLALGVAPRAVALVGSLPATGGFLLLTIADSTGAPDWVRQLSPFAHLAAVPSTAPNWPATVTMVAIAGLLTILGLGTYQRRDLRIS